MTRIGVTGVFGAGKTAVCRALDLCGVPGVSCDDIVRRLRRSPEAAAEICRLLGPRVMGPDGLPDARRVATAIFRDPRARRRLEELLHPAVFAQMERYFLDFRAGGCTIVYAEVPLLFETHSERRFDRILVVHADPGAVRARLAPFYTTDETALRLKAQMPQDAKMRRADHLIDNSGPVRETAAGVRSLVAGIRSGAV